MLEQKAFLGVDQSTEEVFGHFKRIDEGRNRNRNKELAEKNCSSFQENEKRDKSRIY